MNFRRHRKMDAGVLQAAGALCRNVDDVCFCRATAVHSEPPRFFPSPLRVIKTQGEIRTSWRMDGCARSSYLLVLFAEILMMVSVCRAMAIHSEPPKIKQGELFPTEGRWMSVCAGRSVSVLQAAILMRFAGVYMTTNTTTATAKEQDEF